MRFQVEDRKVTHYLLASPAKAPFFLGAGYTLARWGLLRDDLLRHPSLADFEGFRPDSWGMKRRYRCAMPVAPNGRLYCVRTVWQLQPGEVWKFITAYPQ
jgi:hypothetical protein